jgi:hypothetical protein
VLAGYERKDIRLSENDPVKLAYARSNVLHMLRNHCAVDITAKEAGDLAACRRQTTGNEMQDTCDLHRGPKPLATPA